MGITMPLDSSGSLSAIGQAIEAACPQVLSTDLFDTVLLRDRSVESQRLATACRLAAPQLGVDATVLTRLRWDFQDSAYRAVAMAHPEGDASLAAICHTVAAALGLGQEAGRALHRAEVDVDIEHLRPHRPFLELLNRGARSGARVIAVSDTIYDGADLKHILDAVVGPHSIAAVYSSSDLGLTKHAGGAFEEVARREGVPADRILHVGDNHRVDVEMARRAGWGALHVPRDRRHRAAKIVGRLQAVPIKIRRAR